MDIRTFQVGVVSMSEAPSKFEEGVGITGRWMQAKADEWIAKNEGVWSKMMEVAAGYVAQGRRFSMETLLQFARYSCNPQAVTAFKVDNNIRSALARRMVEAHPAWSKYVDMRNSKVDML